MASPNPAPSASEDSNAHVIGIDLGGTKIWGVRLDGDDQVMDEHKVPTPSGADAVVSGIVTLVNTLMDTGSVGTGPARAGRVAAIGIGAPGMVTDDGVLLSAPNVEGLAGFGLREAVETALMSNPSGPLSVYVDNDATCTGWAERSQGAGHGCDNVLVVALGTGIGGGIVSGSQLLRGAHGFGGEIGHMVINPVGPPCPCGKRGCWERYASGSGLGRLARDAADAGQAEAILALAGGQPAQVRGEHVTTAAAHGDRQALDILEQFGRWVALGLANLVEIFDPDTIVLAGGLIQAGDLIVGPVRDAFIGSVQAGSTRPEIPIVPAGLGPRAGAIGAGLVGRYRFG